MFRQRWPYHVSSASFPRIRGDVPPQISARPALFPFSPHTRGCSLFLTITLGLPQVFPAYAGMFRRPMRPNNRPEGFPRIRGDVPFVTAVKNAITRFSPHTRGCSLGTTTDQVLPAVFPAYAGMFRWANSEIIISSSFPRIRGDVPKGKSAG